MSHDLELASLYKELGEAFAKSDIKAIGENKWNYSLLATPFYKNSLVVVGFNFGAIDKESYPKQEVNNIPTENWSDQKDLGSLIRIKKYLNHYCPEYNLDQIVQTNYCFFRSKKEEDISQHDIELCEPIFQKLLELLQPQFILCLSSKLSTFLRNKYPSTFETKEIRSSKRSVSVFKGLVNINNKQVGIGYIPHPNYSMSKASRIEAWDFVFKK